MSAPAPASSEQPFATCFVSELGPLRGERLLPQAVPARVTAPTYGGAVLTADVHVVAAADGYVCVRQGVTGADPWHAWVPSELLLRD